jgi:hypothetical protein
VNPRPPPTCTITANTTSIFAGQSVILTVSASSSASTLAFLNVDQDSPNQGHYGVGDTGTEFPNNSSDNYPVPGSVSSFTRQLTLTLNTPGTYKFHGSVSDNNGGFAASPSFVFVTVTAPTPPSSTITASAASIVTGQSVVLTVQASAPNSNLSWVNIDQISPSPYAGGYYGAGDTGTEVPPSNGQFYPASGHNFTRVLTLTLNTPGTYCFRGAVNDGTNWYYGPATVTVVVAPPNGTGNGLQADYYNNVDFTGLVRSAIDPSINYSWGAGAPTGLDPDTFSIRWTGQIQPRYTGSYTFIATSDDAIRVSIGGQQIINDWVDHGAREASGVISLVAGQKYDIMVEFHEVGGDALAKLEWMSSAHSREVVPSTQPYPAGTYGDGATKHVFAANYTGTDTENHVSDGLNIEAGDPGALAGPSGSTVIVNAGAHEDYVVRTTKFIHLINGFHAVAGSVFTARLSDSNSNGNAPSILTQPQSRSVAIGTNVTFSVTASGAAPLGYQWKKGGAAISGATASSYSLANVQSTDAGSYSVTVSNGYGSVDSTAAVLAVSANLPIFSSLSVASGTVGTPFGYNIVATPGVTGYAADGLPSFLSVDDVTGRISGTPTATGVWNVTLSATNANGTATMTLIITVTAQGDLLLKIHRP